MFITRRSTMLRRFGLSLALLFAWQALPAVAQPPSPHHSRPGHQQHERGERSDRGERLNREERQRLREDLRRDDSPERERWRQERRERSERMTPDERQHLREQLRGFEPRRQ